MVQQILPSNTFTTAKWVVSPSSNVGTHTTIGGALTSASSGDTIFILPGTYTENLTLKAGVNLTASGSDWAGGAVTIIGKATATFAGTATISNIELTTSSDFFLVISGSNATVVNLYSCYFNCLNNTGISFTASNAGATIICWSCNGNIATTGITLVVASSTGSMSLFYCDIINNGNATTASSGAATQIYAEFCTLGFAFTFTTTGFGQFYNCIFNYGSITNTTAVTTAGTGASHLLSNCYVLSGTASAVSIGTGTTCAIYNCTINSSNTNALTGAGTLVISGVTYSGTSHQSNVTTQTGGAISGLTQGTAPSVGYIGENISSTVFAVATTTTVAKSITSISLTPGIWDVSGMITSVATGGTVLMQSAVLSVSTTNNTQTTPQAQTNQAALSVLTLTVPPIRATLSATTIYYLVATNAYSSTTCPTNGYITATRVG